MGIQDLSGETKFPCHFPVFFDLSNPDWNVYDELPDWQKKLVNKDDVTSSVTQQDAQQEADAMDALEAAEAQPELEDDDIPF